MLSLLLPTRKRRETSFVASIYLISFSYPFFAGYHLTRFKIDEEWEPSSVSSSTTLNSITLVDLNGDCILTSPPFTHFPNFYVIYIYFIYLLGLGASRFTKIRLGVEFCDGTWLYWSHHISLGIGPKECRFDGFEKKSGDDYSFSNNGIPVFIFKSEFVSGICNLYCIKMPFTNKDRSTIRRV